MSSLSTYHAEQMVGLSSDFFEGGNGLRAVRRRTAAVDDIVRGRFEEAFESYGGGIAAIAVGGYGRSELFPQSDVDLLLLFRRAREAQRHRDQISVLLAALWDSKLRVSHSVRDPRDCTSLAPNNTELHISLLDTRFIAGDRPFFDEFLQSTLPRFYLREQRALLRSLTESARKRHRLFDRTIYHLEPNVKEGPGGLRVYHLACWVAQLDNVGRKGVPASEEFLPRHPDWDVTDAKRFLFAVRCYLHFYYGRDKNLLSFDMQDTIATAAAGKAYPGDGDPSELMQAYFRSTRSIHRLALRLVDESTAPTSSLLALFRKRKSRLSNRFFSVSNGRIYFKDSNTLRARPEQALGVFQFQARHGLPLAAETENRIRAHSRSVRAHFDSNATLWPRLREVFGLPHAYRALESMRETGVLYSLFPAFELIDCMVVRDFHHRYTVDVHTLMTIRVLQDLPSAADPIDQRYARLHREVGRLDLLCCALLFHDIGKGAEGSGHDEASGKIAADMMRRIGLNDAIDRDTVLYLVREHLSMSEVMTKRDLSEPAVLEGFKTRVKTVERLKLLTLMTYADTVAVNPHATSSWRKELLWRLYLGVHAVFQRDHEDNRIGPGAEEGVLKRTAGPSEKRRMKRFLQGFPLRYLRTHTGEEIHDHFRLAAELRPGCAEVTSNRIHGDLEVVVLSWERPFLFASLCAAIASFGFNIEHAEAFSNDDGLVLDTFRMSGPRHAPGAELDPRDLERFEQQLRRVAEGSLNPGELLRKIKPAFYRRRNVEPPQVSFENETSARATIFYIQAPDRSGLLYDLSSIFSQHECDIDVVLCQTQGRRAIDVFYLQRRQKKLTADTCETLRAELLEACLHGSLN